MLRILLIIILLLSGLAAYLWFSVQSLPDWYAENDNKQQQNIERLSQAIERQGVAHFLGDKFADVLRGDVVFSEDEFNALVLSSLRNHTDGQRLLAVSEAVHTDLTNGEIEFGAVINMAALARAEPKAKQAFERAMQVLPLKADDEIFVAIVGTPIARNGNLALADDVRVRIGSIEISNGVLSRLGVPVHKLNQEDLPLQRLRLSSITPLDGEIRIVATPRF